MPSTQRERSGDKSSEGTIRRRIVSATSKAQNKLDIVGLADALTFSTATISVI